MNSKAFYDSIRQTIFKGSISAKQFEGLEAIINEYNSRCLNDLRKLAYILATAYHETAQTLQPIREYGQGKNYDYGKKLKMSRRPYVLPNKLYFGRGHIQLTWYENYEAMGKALKIDLLNNPDLALQMDISIKILFEGMTKGMFTGKKLADYFTADKSDAFNARKIVNGLDSSKKIEGYFNLFYGALIMK
jgi:putative chitinase